MYGTTWSITRFPRSVNCDQHLLVSWYVMSQKIGEGRAIKIPFHIMPYHSSEILLFPKGRVAKQMKGRLWRMM